MIINWLLTKTQRFFPEYDTEQDELSVNFDLTLSAEIIEQLSAQNSTGQPLQAANANAVAGFALDEHELALTC